MKTYAINYTKISEAESCLYSAARLTANECYDAVRERIEEARKLLQEFLSQDNLVEDPDTAYGIVRQLDAEAAILDAIESAKNVHNEAINAMVESCKQSNAAKMVVSYQRPDGYIVETVVRKKDGYAKRKK